MLRLYGVKEAKRSVANEDLILGLARTLSLHSSNYCKARNTSPPAGVYSLFKDPECQHKVQRTQFQSVALRSAGGGCNTLFPRNGAVKYNQDASAVKYNLDGPEITGTFYDKRDCTGAEMPLRDTVVGQCTKSFKKYHGTEKWYTVSCS